MSDPQDLLGPQEQLRGIGVRPKGDGSDPEPATKPSGRYDGMGCCCALALGIAAPFVGGGMGYGYGGGGGLLVGVGVALMIDVMVVAWGISQLPPPDETQRDS